LEDKLLVEINNGAIICLQEVSTEWAGYLHSFFAENNYVLITGLYGKKFNGYMGVATAVPLHLYKIQSASIDTLSDFIPEELLTPKKPWTAPPKKDNGVSVSGVFKALLNCFNLFMKLVCSWFGSSEKAEDPAKKDPWADEPPFDGARYRVNQMISVTLLPLAAPAAAAESRTGRRKSGAQAPKSAEFLVSNYHMPCMFKKPFVMTIHSTLAALVTRKLATIRKGRSTVVIPHVLAGDFNLTPVSGMYHSIVTTCRAGNSHAPVFDGVDTIPPNFDKFLTLFYSEQGLHHDNSEDDVSVIKDDIKFYSLYREVNGEEPDFTNYATAMSWGGGKSSEFTFIDTLDYLFVSTEGWAPITSDDAHAGDADATVAKSTSVRRKSGGRSTKSDALSLSPADTNKHMLIPVHHRDSVTEATAESSSPKVDKGLFGPYPSKDEHSDHIMIGGSLYLN